MQRRSFSASGRTARPICQTKLSGRLDREGVSRPERTAYELVGFCKDGMELLDQPVYCDTKQIDSEGGGYRYQGKCRVKDYPYKSLSFRIKAQGQNAISFNENDFDHDYFWISGNYVRCSLTYKCENK